jgi:hypothetical protein
MTAFAVGAFTIVFVVAMSSVVQALNRIGDKLAEHPPNAIERQERLTKKREIMEARRGFIENERNH